MAGRSIMSSWFLAGQRLWHWLLALPVVFFTPLGSHSLAAQASVAEVVVANAAQLAQWLPRITAMTLVARSTEAGARLPDLPEHSSLLEDPAVRAQLLASLASNLEVGDAFGLGNTQAELLLHLDGRRVVRGRLQIDATKVRFGAAEFAFCSVLPDAVATALRVQWQQLATVIFPARRKVQVSSLRELIAAIASDRAIELTGGPFELSSSDGDSALPANPAITFHVFEGLPYLEIHGVHNLHVRSLGDRCRVLGKSPADVIAFVNCSAVCLEGLILGHVEGLAGSCSAPVVNLNQCQGLLLRDCELFGCGTMGVVAATSRDLRMERCEVHSCSAGIAQFINCDDVKFRATSFRDCRMVGFGFSFTDCSRVSFRDCEVRRMEALWNGDISLFEVRMDEAVQFAGGVIRGNSCRRVVNSKLLLVRNAVDEGENGAEIRLPSEGSVQESPGGQGKG
ncbi:hypothetical protein LBMAG49_07110 [Planctomycetota bacterium]|nr:hypothetical protein LBMAG49_07110 [Planctomycetota bacterium]